MEFNLWNYKLNKTIIENIQNCQVLYKGNIISWTLNSIEVYGKNTADFLFQEACYTPQKFVLVKEKMTRNSAKAYCDVHDGYLYTPRSKLENEEMENMLNSNSVACTTSGSYLAWLGIELNDGGKWIDPKDNKEIVFNLIEYGHKMNNIAMFVVGGMWYDSSHKDRIKLCFLCGFNMEPIYSLKGICHDSLYSFNYYLEDKNTEIIGYAGYKGSFINITQSHLQLANGLEEKSELAKLSPFGRNLWSVEDKECPSRQGEILLTFSKCNALMQFTCTSGYCIDISKRCNNKYDCDDGSDEESCLTIITESTLNTPPQQKDHRCEILTKVVINQFNQINSFDTTITLTMEISLSWSDHRIVVMNLPEYNRTHEQKVEVLGIKFINT